MIKRADGIVIYEDGDKRVYFEDALYNMNRNIRILSEKVDSLEIKGDLIRCEDCRHWKKLVLNSDGDGCCRADK